MPSAKELAKALAYRGEIRNTPQNRFLGGVANFLAPVSEFADRDKLPESIPLLGGMSFADLSGLKGTQSLVNDISYGKPPIRGATLNTVKVDPRLLDVAGLGGAMFPIAKNLTKAALREGARQIETGTGIGRAVVDLRSPITTWHGSPHTFPPTANNPLGEFDPMMAGTGTGAQAYGVGAGYLSDSPVLAKGYANNLAARVSDDKFKLQYQRDAAIARGDTAKAQELSNELQSGYGQNLYKVDLPDEHVAKMLDWDKPLSEQHPDVQVAVQQWGDNFNPTDTGEHIYRKFSSGAASGHNVQQASRALQQLGITGIRYLDAASRDAAGKGTSNFVVFDPKHMNILERNGVGGAMIPRPKTEFEILHDTAQRNAALPVEQGGLGLPANNTYIDRANAMYPTDAYHFTNARFSEFDPKSIGSATDEGWLGSGFYTTTDKKLGDNWNKQVSMPMRVADQNNLEVPYTNFGQDKRSNVSDALGEMGNMTPIEVNDALNSLGKTGITMDYSPSGYLHKEIMSVAPNQLRSRFAAFDPMRRHEADILAGVGVGGMLDPQAIAEALRQQDRK